MDKQEAGLPLASHRFLVPFAFPVVFTRSAWEPDNRTIVDAIRRLEPDRRHRALVVIDEHLAQAQPWLVAGIQAYFDAHAASLVLVAPPLIVPGGEVVKNDLAHAWELLRRINDVGLDRQSFVIIMGGGALLDMASFAAAIAHRGIRVVRLPTTVLAQGDSGVAVKNGVNLFGKKNFIGTFVPPFAVVNDTTTLDTLPIRDKIAGAVEAVKVALLRSPDFFSYLERHRRNIAAGDRETLSVVVERSAALHLEHICGNGDPFELGSARPLDFGHWAAHKLESMTSHRLRHGEAVAIGMAMDLMYSHAKGFLDRVTCERVLRLLESFGLRLWDDALTERAADGRHAIIAGLHEFREHLGGELHITLLRGVGQSFEVTDMDETPIAEGIEALARRASIPSEGRFARLAAGAAQ